MTSRIALSLQARPGGRSTDRGSRFLDNAGLLRKAGIHFFAIPAQGQNPIGLLTPATGLGVSGQRRTRCRVPEASMGLNQHLREDACVLADSRGPTEAKRPELARGESAARVTETHDRHTVRQDRLANPSNANSSRVLIRALSRDERTRAVSKKPNRRDIFCSVDFAATLKNPEGAIANSQKRKPCGRERTGSGFFMIAFSEVEDTARRDGR